MLVIFRQKESKSLEPSQRSLLTPPEHDCLAASQLSGLSRRSNKEPFPTILNKHILSPLGKYPLPSLYILASALQEEENLRLLRARPTHNCILNPENSSP